MNLRRKLLASVVLGSIFSSSSVMAAVSVEEAEQLKTTLTPFGAERAGNADGTIPAWEGVYDTPDPGYKPGGPHSDPWADEKPLFSINAGNVDEYADKLSEGTVAMLKRYPESYRLDIYPTHRTGGGPQWVYDNTYQNALNGELVNDVPDKVFGGIPFPIPKSGAEVMWNHLLRWIPGAYTYTTSQYQLTSNGQKVMISTTKGDFQAPYYLQDSSREEFEKSREWWLFKAKDTAPPIRAGEQLLLRFNMDPTKDRGWTYLLGQRRVRKIPNPCCDNPNPISSGLGTIDETQTWNGRLDRFDWKIVEKKEMYIPYNSNRMLQPAKDEETLSDHHLNPDYIRWELHRVWVVEANLREGERHVAQKSLYYCDEDTWMCMLGDRWDGNGQLWRNIWTVPITIPSMPGIFGGLFGSYDLLSGTAFVSTVMNEGVQFTVKEPYQEGTFMPDSLAGDGLR